MSRYETGCLQKENPEYQSFELLITRINKCTLKIFLKK